MANFQVTIYFNNEGDLTQSLVLDVSADDEDEAIELAKFYIENDKRREEIKIAAMNKVRNEHTYLHRFQEIFNKI